MCSTGRRWIGAAAWIPTGVSVWIVAAGATAAPLVAGNFSIADKVLHGDAHVIILGDSLQNNLTGIYTQYWNPDHVTGQAIIYQPNTGDSGAFSTVVPSPLVTATSQLYFPINSPFGSTPPDGLTGLAPREAPHVSFTGTAGATTGNLLTNRVFETDFERKAWTHGAAGQVNVGVMTYANPNGVAAGKINLVIQTDSYSTAAASAPISTYAATPGYQSQTIAVPTQAWQSANALAVQYSVLPGQSPAPGSNLIVTAERMWTGEPGFQLVSIVMGAESVPYYLDPANCSDAGLAAYLQFTDSNIAYIWLGAQGSGETSGPVYENQMKQLIQRYKTARPGMQFVLVSTYDLGYPVLGQYADALYDISQTDSSVLFLNLYQSAGDFTFLNQNYLADSSHTNAAGSIYMAEQTASLFQSAAAQAPEPTGLQTLAFFAVPLLVGRRRKRAMGIVS